MAEKMIVNDDIFQYIWKKRPSEIRGFQRTLYLNAENGDYLRIDYTLKDNRVRIYVEITSEGGSPYYAIISNGKITAEKNVLSGRTFGCASKFQERAEIFATIPNKTVMKLINKNYGIGQAPLKRKTEKKEELERTRKRYFKPQKNPYTSGSGGYGALRAPKEGFSFFDIIDILAGIVLSLGLFYYFQYNFLLMGAVAAFFGVSIGLVDLFLRERAPILFKVIFFVTTGTAFYIYGYFW
ncbi:MAG: hypothetical protein GY754_20080 [bacterium]|nr:hypothetical protein [bacterium]